VCELCLWPEASIPQERNVTALSELNILSEETRCWRENIPKDMVEGWKSWAVNAMCCYRGSRRVSAAPLQVRGGLGDTGTPSGRAARRRRQTDPADDSSTRFIRPPIDSSWRRRRLSDRRRWPRVTVDTPAAALVRSWTHQSCNALRRQRLVRQTTVFLLRPHETLNPTTCWAKAAFTHCVCNWF